MCRGLVEQAGLAETGRDGCEQLRRRRQVEQGVRAGAVRGLQFGQACGDVGIEVRLLDVADDDADAAEEPVALLLRERRVEVLVGGLQHVVGQRLADIGLTDHRDEGKRRGQRARSAQVHERRHELAARQVAGRAEADEHGRIRRRDRERPRRAVRRRAHW